MHWEVEQKFAIHDVADAIARLAAVGAHFSPGIQQTDQYFNHPARNFATTDEALRIRRGDSESFITYKGPKIDPTTKTRQELEIPLPPGVEVPDQFTELLTALGFHPVEVVRKSRRLAMIAWQGHDVEMALDEVENLGTFLELEISVDDAKLHDAKAALGDLSRHLGFGPSERRSYLELLLAGKP
jgi:adenylate cyclase, class 2